jgi:biopolymer transport protein ExbD
VRMRSVQHAPPLGKINVTPLIDVVMVLIVFYLIVGRLAESERARVELPGATAGAAESGAAVTITVSLAGGRPSYSLEGVSVPVGDLARAIRTAVPSPGDTAVHIRADRTLAYDAVEPAILACREAGLASVKLVAQREGGSP